MLLLQNYSAHTDVKRSL